MRRSIRISASGARRRSARWRPPSPGGSTPPRIVAVLGKTEGNGCVNDFSRGFATAGLTRRSRRHLPPTCADVRWSCRAAPRARWRRIGSCSRRATPPTGRIGAGARRRARRAPRTCAPEQIGRMAQARPWPRRCGRRWPRPVSPKPTDVHFVQVKCPLLTPSGSRAAEARATGRDPRYAEIDGAVARCRGARRRHGAWARCRAAIREDAIGARLAAVLVARLGLGRHRADRTTRSSCSARARPGAGRCGSTHCGDGRTPSTSSRCAPLWRLG